MLVIVFIHFNLLFCSWAFAQEQDRGNELLLNAGIGLLTEAETQEIKQLMPFFIKELSYDIKLRNDLSVSPALEWIKLFYDYQNSSHQNLYNTRVFFGGSFFLKKSFFYTARSRVIFGIGPNVKHNSKYIKENVAMDDEEIIRNLGWNFGLGGMVYYEFDVGGRWEMTIGTKGVIELRTSYKEENEEIKLGKNQSTIVSGINFKL